MRRPFFLLPLLTTCFTPFTATALLRHSHSHASFTNGLFTRSIELRVADLKAAGKGKGVGGKGSSRSGPSLPSPRSDNQKLYVDYLNDPLASMIFSVGPAGTGKTLFACSAAVQELKRGSIEKIILTRPVVSVDEDLGFLPGSLDDKMAPWTRPMFDILAEFFSQKEVDAMVSAGTIEISPLAFMRGRTFKRSFIVADEMQNSSPTQMFMLTTRLGEGSRMVITGDLGQSDRSAYNGQNFRSDVINSQSTRSTSNGLADILSKLKSYRGSWDTIRLIELGVQDVERSVTVSKILEIYEGAGHGGGTNVNLAEPTTKIVNDVDKSNLRLDSLLPSVQDEQKRLANGPNGPNGGIGQGDCALIPNDPLSRRTKN